jgi:phosphoribosylformimino-5-aminoimidazole carboxamide ribotide isomerase
MQIIPAIDIIEGKCVRLTQGDYSQKTIYNNDPLQVAMEFQDNGIRRLHLVDLDGAREGRIINYKALESIVSKTRLVVDFGGGIKTEKDIESVYNSGAQLATIGSIAARKPELFLSWITKFGSEKILLGADVKDEKVAINAWTEKTQINIFDFTKENLAGGVTQMFCTDISKDGKLLGPSVELYKKMIGLNPGLKLIASGGISCMDDLVRLEEIGCAGAIIGKALYEGRITLKDLALFNINASQKNKC